MMHVKLLSLFIFMAIGKGVSRNQAPITLEAIMFVYVAPGCKAVTKGSGWLQSTFNAEPLSSPLCEKAGVRRRCLQPKNGYLRSFTKPKAFCTQWHELRNTIKTQAKSVQHHIKPAQPHWPGTAAQQSQLLAAQKLEGAPSGFQVDVNAFTFTTLNCLSILSFFKWIK